MIESNIYLATAANPTRMLKFVPYTLLLMTSFFIMGHTKRSLVSVEPDLLKSSSAAFSDSRTGAINASADFSTDCYTRWQLDRQGLSQKAFTYALRGLGYFSRANLISKKNIISIVDFSKPSTEKRLFVIDVSTGKILFKTWVAHGQNSGNEYANRFSNLPDSHQSSLGFYITMDTYNGGNGYSLRLKGCEKGINDNAYERSIVIHGADYVSDRFINSRGELGRSYGCPAVPAELSQKIIDVIKNGSCLFLYHPTKKYCSRSRIINGQV